MTRLLLAALLTLLAGCTGPAPMDGAAVDAAAEGRHVQVTAEPEAPERPFPEASIYPLLVAEFALRRRDYATALENYVAQAPLLRDPGVSAHTTHLAQFLQREPEALEAVRLWVELAPDDVEANNTLAILLVRRGRNLEAAPHLEVVARSGAQANFPILLNGFKQMDPGGRARLVSAINELADAFPDDTQMLLTQALLHEELGQERAALDKLERLFELEPYQTQAVLLEAQLLLQLEDPRPFDRIEAALQAQPEDQQLRLQYARLLTGTDLEAARGQFEILSAQSPHDGDLLLSLALINREIGDDQAARAYLTQLLELGQRRDDAHLYLGMMAEEAGDLEQAIGHYRQVTGGSDFYTATGRTGRILLEQDESGRAGEFFAGLRQQHPDRSERLFALEAELRNRTGDTSGAVAVLGAGLREHPQSTSLRYSRSMLAEQLGDLKLMESDLRAIIAADPDNATALNALGYTLANRTERYAEAYELIDRALVLEPDEPAILDSMGWILFRQGQYEEALQFLRRAYAEFPDPEVAAHLGEVLWVSGDTAGAAAIWREGLQRDPEHAVLRETLRRLGITRADLDG